MSFSALCANPVVRRADSSCLSGTVGRRGGWRAVGLSWPALKGETSYFKDRFSVMCPTEVHHPGPIKTSSKGKKTQNMRAN